VALGIEMKRMDLRDRLSLEHPILQAGMGGGLAGAELATAVSNAGGLGTVGFAPPREFERDIERTKSETGGRSYAANLLMPFALRAHVRACLTHRVPVVTVFFGFDAAMIRALKEAGTYIISQVGTEMEAERVVAAGADALIVQGHEAGGHVRGTERLAVLFPTIRERFRAVPVIASGGIWDRDSAAKARSLGADGVSCGTRFLMTDESRAHPMYKRRLVEADSTVVTTLFGIGWPAPHRVVSNQALRRWCDDNGQPRAGIRAINWLSQFGAKLAPPEQVHRMTRSQRLGRPLYTPESLVVGMDPRLIEVTPAYAGECVSNITASWPAAHVVDELAKGF
jgi:NAD(P)H-dependent flavin oxidoreductase YrpB (nitropropane dioxygenase family)